MTPGKTIFIVDDEAAARETTGEYLSLHGFDVRLLDGGTSLREALRETTPALVVLDLNMPEEDGLSIVRFLKQGMDVPVIMLTATASPIDRVVGLELGADDYLAKPCELRELLARIRSVLRRSAPVEGTTAQQPPPPPQPSGVRIGSRWLDPERRVLRDPDGTEHLLTASEFGLLKAFADNPGRVLSREHLLDVAAGRDGESFDRAVDVRITRIRRKVETDPAQPRLIRTIRGAGYMFCPDGEAGERS
jgi:two-component system, OmpR family, response regulator